MLLDMIPEVITSQSNPIITLDKKSTLVNVEVMISASGLSLVKLSSLGLNVIECDSRDCISSMKCNHRF